MSIAEKVYAAVRNSMVMRTEMDALSKRFDELSAQHADTRDRVIRIEGLIEGATMRLPRR